RGELGELTRPHVGRDDPLARYPVSIDVDELLDRPATGGSVTAPDENAIRFREVAYGTALGEELRVREDLQPGSRPGIEDALHGLGRPYGQRALLDHDLVGSGMLENLPRRPLPVLEVGRFAGTLPVGLRRGVDAHEDDVGLGDTPRDVDREEEIA